MAYAGKVKDLTGIKTRFAVLNRFLDERSRRLLAGAESLALGRGGMLAVSRVTGLSRPVIRQGVEELKDGRATLSGRVRAAGWGTQEDQPKRSGGGNGFGEVG